MTGFRKIKKSIPTYFKLIGWWIHNHKIKIPDKIRLTSENSPFGYDWSWAVLDNGWTLFYGNILFWMMKGPAAGTLTLTKDGENYTEFADVEFNYINTASSSKYDFIYPTEFEVSAKNKNERLYLKYKMTQSAYEYVSKFKEKKFWHAFVICEAPGSVEGYYEMDNKRQKITGFCKIEPQRQVSILGHNSLTADILKPPKGFGITVEFDSNFFKKKIFSKIQLAPDLKFKFNINHKLKKR